MTASRLLRRCAVVALVPALAACSSLFHPRPTLRPGSDVAVPQRKLVDFVGKNGEDCVRAPAGPVQIGRGEEVACTRPGADTLNRGPRIAPADPAHP